MRVLGRAFAGQTVTDETRNLLKHNYQRSCVGIAVGEEYSF